MKNLFFAGVLAGAVTALAFSQWAKTRNPLEARLERAYQAADEAETSLYYTRQLYREEQEKIYGLREQLQFCREGKVSR